MNNEMEDITAKLEAGHAANLACEKGCCECCMNLTVFPVEFFSIVEEIKQAGWPKPTFNQNLSCGFLNDEGLCAIYPFRPIICRTHGLPIVFLNDEIEPAEYSVSFCPKSFLDADLDNFEFNEDNTMPIDQLNNRLFTINVEFVNESNDQSLTSTTRIDLQKILEYL